MSNRSKAQEDHVLEAIYHDVSVFLPYVLSLKNHPGSSLLLQGTLPFNSLFIIESANAIDKLFPGFLNIEIDEGVSIKELVQPLYPLRQKAKMFDNANQPFSGILSELSDHINKHRSYFFDSGSGILSPVKRMLQADLGLFYYGSNIFANTHELSFNYGETFNFDNPDNKDIFSNRGYIIGRYATFVSHLFGFEMPDEIHVPKLELKTTMVDIKYESLYRRGIFKHVPLACAASFAFLLSNLNQVISIISPAMQKEILPTVRVKLIIAYHVNSSLNSLQQLYFSKLSPEVQSLFSQLLGSPESHWLKKLRDLRNTMVHYYLDNWDKYNLPSGSNRIQVIEHLSRGKKLSEINNALDKYISDALVVLEQSFSLKGNPFWYGVVK